MNMMELKKGEGMYVGADGPHAWLKGDIVELMAIRQAFTFDRDPAAITDRLSVTTF